MNGHWVEGNDIRLLENGEEFFMARWPSSAASTTRSTLWPITGPRPSRTIRRKSAARRGVDVRLILQGQPDRAIVKTAAARLYHQLLGASVRICEYTRHPLHGWGLVRTIYCVAPPIVAGVMYLAMELKARKLKRRRELQGVPS